MTRYAAFLRAINAGKGHYMKMDALRAAAASVAGLENVQTYIASGNLIFDAPSSADPAALEQVLEARLRERLGFAVPAFLRTASELREAVTVHPFGELAGAEGAYLNVFFTRAQPSADAVAMLLAAQTATERLHVHGRHVYWLRLRDSAGGLPVNINVEKLTGMATTARNITTPRAILEKFFG